MEKPNLETQITNLQNEIRQLHSNAKHETHPKRKLAFIRQKGEIVTQLSYLQSKRDREIDAQALPKIDEAFHNSDRIIVLIANGNRITLDADLNVIFPFTCGHTKKAHVSKVLCYLREPTNYHALLSAWESTLRTSTVLTSRFNCEQCKRAKAKKFSMFRRHTAKDTIGTCSVTMQII